MREIKRLLNKLTALVVMVAVIMATLPMAGLEGVLGLDAVTVYADATNPFDCRDLTVTSSGKYSGIAWTMYDNGLLWIVDDTSGETKYGDSSVFNGEKLMIGDLSRDVDFTTAIEDIKFVYMNATAPKSCFRMFYGCTGLIEVVYDYAFTSTSANVTNMSYMYYNCKSLVAPGLAKVNTSNVTDMEDMFSGCKSLYALDLSTFDTSNVTIMRYMFNGCSALTSLNLSNFNTSNVTSMYGMFNGCASLQEVDLSMFNTGKVQSMSTMFWGCSSLVTLDLRGFDTSQVDDMYWMFLGCTALKSVDVSNFNTSKVQDMSLMFESCESLESLDLSGFDTSNVTDMERMFHWCKSLKRVDVSNFNTSNVTHMRQMFAGCPSLESLDISSFDVSNVTSMDYFIEGSSLHVIKCPTNVASEPTIYLSGTWCELMADGSVNRTVEYESLPRNKSESITIIRELTHQCDNISDGKGTCSLCGMHIVYGDNNDDNKINISDAVMLKKHLAGEDDVNMNVSAANVNGDSAITVSDAVKLMKKLAGMDVELGVAD